MKFRTAAFVGIGLVVTAFGLGSAWYAYKNAMIQRDIRARVMGIQDDSQRLMALARRAAADPTGPLPSPGVERAQLEAIAEMARQARDSALLTRLAVAQMPPSAAPDRARCDTFADSLSASVVGRSPAYGAFVTRYLADCATNRDATIVDALERALGTTP